MRTSSTLAPGVLDQIPPLYKNVHDRFQVLLDRRALLPVPVSAGGAAGSVPPGLLPRRPRRRPLLRQLPPHLQRRRGQDHPRAEHLPLGQQQGRIEELIKFTYHLILLQYEEWTHLGKELSA